MSGHLEILADPIIERAFQEIIVSALRIVPNLAAALVVFVVAAEVGEVLEDAVERAVGATELAGALEDSPLGEVLPAGGVGSALGTAVRYYVLLVALVAIASTLGFEALLVWLVDAATYAPALAGGLLVLVFGVVAAERVTRTLGDGGTGTAVRLTLYAAVALLALEMMGAGGGALGTVVALVVGAVLLAAAIALGLGGAIALGLGGREYVADAIDDLDGDD